MKPDLERGDVVNKLGGDYTYCGTVVAVFQKWHGEWRIVVEDMRGLLLIMNPKQVEKTVFQVGLEGISHES